MTIGFDLRCLPSDGTVGAGIAHAARELWHQLLITNQQSPITQLIGFAPRGADLSAQSIVWLPDASGASLRMALRHHSVDRLFVASGAVPWGIHVPVYPWVHDVAIYDHPEWFPQSWFKRTLTTTLFRRGLKQAKHIFCVSENSKQALVHRFHLDSTKMTVTLQGVQRGEEDGITSGTGMFALLMGTVEPRKNIPFLISLWPEVCKRLGHVADLVIAGSDGWGEVLSQKSKVKSVVRKKNVSDEEYHELLKTVRMLLTPSLYEGFGRPAVEAMSWGVPVIVSDRGALPEVVGDGGMILSLDDRAAWIEAIVRLFSEQSFYEEQSKRALKRSRAFQWEQIASLILSEIEKTAR